MENDKLTTLIQMIRSKNLQDVEFAAQLLLNSTPDRFDALERERLVSHIAYVAYSLTGKENAEIHSVLVKCKRKIMQWSKVR